jgi:hypothetical protein
LADSLRLIPDRSAECDFVMNDQDRQHDHEAIQRPLDECRLRLGRRREDLQPVGRDLTPSGETWPLGARPGPATRPGATRAKQDLTPGGET